MEHRVLGKGLSALIPEKKVFESDGIGSDSVSYVKTGLVRDSGQQPRQDYNHEKLDELVSSIREKGVLQPILVRKQGEGYEVIAGERRLKAARALRLDKIPAIIKDVTDEEALVLALVENIQREELNAIEEAGAFAKLINQFRLSQEEVARAVGKDPSTISNTLRLLKLPERIQKSVVADDLSMGHARALLAIENPFDQNVLFEETITKKLSVRELESLIRKQNRKKLKIKSRGHDLVFLEEELQQILGTKVRIQAGSKRGKILVDYYSPDDLERIIKIIREKVS